MKIVWKRRWQILLGALALGLLTFVVSTRMTKYYSISIVLQPGILERGRGSSNEVLYVDTMENIRAQIELGTYSRSILEKLESMGYESNENELRFKISMPARSNSLKISYVTSDVEKGGHVLETLSGLIGERYALAVGHQKSEFEYQIELERTEIKKLEAKKIATHKKIKSISERIGQLEEDMKAVADNTDLLAQARKRFVSGIEGERELLPSLLFLDAIQEGLTRLDEVKREVSDYQILKEEQAYELDALEGQIAIARSNIEKLNRKKSDVQPVQILQKPEFEQRPIRPRVALNACFGFFVGLLGMICIALFLERTDTSRSR